VRNRNPRQVFLFFRLDFLIVLCCQHKGRCYKCAGHETISGYWNYFPAIVPDYTRNKCHCVETVSVEAVEAYRVVEYSLLASGFKWIWVVSFTPRQHPGTRRIRSWEDPWASQVTLENRRISWPAGNQTTILRVSRRWPSRYTLYTKLVLNKSHTLVKRTLCYNWKVLIFAIVSPSTVGDTKQLLPHSLSLHP